ncbi:sulfotransferase domain-containing protein [Salinibacter ruber]|uniref:sulfotransferase domain-containing protein n=1 Tax=Salinibacter ruber TaxID=146919 RepID=UPI000E584979|nr:sulfotransferase domain-containing protein [Salinibacter ruber]
MRTLDFAVIGAQKAGTTSLRHYLRSHPEIYTPEGETPFFTRDFLYEAGWEEFANASFSSADRECLWGVVSPQYKGDLCAPRRLHQHNSRLKLIVLLRDPIERARSHHRMATRRQQENRSFEEAVLELLDRERIDLSPPPPEPECYLEWSCYGFVLEKYLKYFDREQIILLFTNNLKNNPSQETKKLYSFLEVENEYVPPNVGRKYNDSGPEEILTVIRRAFRGSIIRKFWHRRVNEKTKQNVYDMMRKVISIAPGNIDKPSSKVSKITREKLISFFKLDVKKIEKIQIKYSLE